MSTLTLITSTEKRSPHLNSAGVATQGKNHVFSTPAVPVTLDAATVSWKKYLEDSPQDTSRARTYTPPTLLGKDVPSPPAALPAPPESLLGSVPVGCSLLVCDGTATRSSDACASSPTCANRYAIGTGLPCCVLKNMVYRGSHRTSKHSYSDTRPL